MERWRKRCRGLRKERTTRQKKNGYALERDKKEGKIKENVRESVRAIK